MAPHRVKARAEYQKTERGKEAVRRARQSFIKHHPKTREAPIAVGNAVRDGKLIKMPCEICGNTNAHGHHDDYNKPLDVRWLCVTHHAQWHRNNKPIV